MKSNKRILTIGMLFLLVVAIFFSSREKDYYNASVRIDKEYSDKEERIVYEEFKNYNLNPGKYTALLGIEDYNGGTKVEIVDSRNANIVAEYTFKSGEKNVEISFVIEKYTKELVFRVIKADGKIKLKFFDLSSCYPVYSDAYFKSLLAIMFIFLIAYGNKLRKEGKYELLILTVFSGIVAAPFLVNYVPLGNDTEFHLHRILEVADSFRNGSFPPRVGIYGNITNIMYPNLFLWGPAALLCFGASLTLAYNFLLIFITVARIFIAYYAGKTILDNKCGVIFSLLFSLNVYTYNNIYMRGDIGESLAMVFIPLLLVGIYDIFVKRYFKGVVELFVAVTCIIQSHVVSTLLVGIFLVIVFVFYVVKMSLDKSIYLNGIISFIVTGVVSFGANAWFLGPFLKYWDSNFSINYQYQIEDFAGSALYPFEFFMFQNSIGILNSAKQGVVGVTVLIIFFLYFVTYKDDEYHKKGNSFFLAAIVLLFFQSKLMPWNFLFEKLPFLLFISKIQYVTRFMTFGTVFLSLVGAIAITSDSNSHVIFSDNISKDLRLMIVFFSVLMFFIASSNYLQNPEILLDGESSSTGLIGYEDYSIKGTDYVEATQKIEKGEGATSDSLVTIVNSDRVKNGYSFDYFSAEKNTEHEVIIPTLFYGLHRAVLTTEDSTINLQTSFDEENGFIVAHIPVGVDSGHVSVIYRRTPRFIFCDTVSLIVWMGILLAFVLKIKKKVLA